MSNKILFNNELSISTIEISKKYGMNHRAVIDLIQKYENDISFFGELYKCKSKIAKGRPYLVFYLNEKQYCFLLSLMQNSTTIKEAKKQIIIELYSIKDSVKE